MHGVALVAHSEFLHDANGSSILGLRDGDDALQSGTCECVAQRFARGFRREALPPPLACQPPSNFDFRSPRQRLQTAESDQLIRAFRQQPPEAKSAFAKRRDLSRGEFADAFLGPGFSIGNVTDHFRVLRDRLQLKPIRFLSGLQFEALGFRHSRFSVRIIPLSGRAPLVGYNGHLSIRREPIWR